MKNLSIYVPRNTYIPGETLTGTTTLQIDKELDLRRFWVELVGYERTRVHHHHGKHSHTHIETNTFVYKTKDVWSAGKAKPGTHKFDFEFDIPPDTLPSYSGTNGKIIYQVNSRVDVPLWFDVKDHRFINVVPGRSTYGDKPVDLNVGYPSGHGPGMEIPSNYDQEGFFLNLPRSVYRPGEAVAGTIWVNNPRRKKIRKIDVDIKGVEWVSAQGHTRERTVESQALDIPLEEGMEGTGIPFQVQLPREARTTFLGHLIRFRWEIRVNLDVAWAFDTSAKAYIYVVL